MPPPATSTRREVDAKDGGESIEQGATDAKASADQLAMTDVVEKESSTELGGGTPKKLTFDDENGKMDSVDLVKDDGNKSTRLASRKRAPRWKEPH